MSNRTERSQSANESHGDAQVEITTQHIGPNIGSTTSRTASADKQTKLQGNIVAKEQFGQCESTLEVKDIISLHFYEMNWFNKNTKGMKMYWQQKPMAGPIGFFSVALTISKSSMQPMLTNATEISTATV